MKLGIIREEKYPPDHRVSFTPQQCVKITKNFTHEVIIQQSNIRSFKDSEYLESGLSVSDNLNDCDILFGVKEVPVSSLIPNKTYFFFSHTIKKQPFNKKLLQTCLEKNIRLIDYECLRNEYGIRLVAFGRFAGVVGAYNALRAYGLKYNLYNIKPAYKCFDLTDLFTEIKKVKLPTIKIILTGAGRVSKGALEVLKACGIKGVIEDNYFKKHDQAVYLQIDADSYTSKSNGDEFVFDDFFKNPSDYQTNFERFFDDTDILISGAFWDPNAPKLFDLADVQLQNFKIKVIADITCDIDGSIPTTVRSTTIEDPFFDISRRSLKEESAFQSLDNVTIMAVDNLPCELPRDASSSFGDQLLEHVIPFLEPTFSHPVIRKAIICENGQLTNGFLYLSDYVS